jgi:hypothetical protein
VRASPVAVAALVAALAGCSSARPSAARLSPVGQAAATTAAPSTAASPLTPLQECVSEVTSLLSQDQQAVEDGYPAGISVNSVMAQYGTQSAVFQAYLMLGPAESAYLLENGAGSQPPQFLQVAQACEQYGA